MLVLGIETAGSVCSVGLTDDDTVLAERTVSGQRIHSVRLIPLIDGVLHDAGKCPDDLEGIAVSAGPGSFTGLRIGMTTAKALAHALDLPVTGVPSLDVLAYPLRHTAGPVLVIVPARKGEVYGAVYTPETMPQPMREPAALETGALVEAARRLDASLLVTGEAAGVYRQLLEKELGTGVRFAPASLRQPRGAVVAEIGRIRFDQGRGATAFTLQPEYVRPPSAELVWQARNVR